MIQNQNPLPHAAFILGLAGLLPQVAACILALTNKDLAIYALVSGFAYAALIFSFIGGVWWGQALTTPTPQAWIFVAAVCPSLFSWGSALLMLLNIGWWPYAIGMVAMGLLVSPIIDLQIGKVITQPQTWMKLRWTLSIVLGGLTLTMAIIARHTLFKF